MNNRDTAYYLERAEQEEEAARRAVNPRAATIHRTLAIGYRAMAVDRISELPMSFRDDERKEFSVVRD
jgi:hypothetical protein